MNSLRLIGGAAMCLAACFVGLRSALNARRQIENAERLRHSLKLMQCEIDYGKTPLPELCKRLSQASSGSVGAFYRELGQRLPRADGHLASAVDESLRVTPALELPDGIYMLLRDFLRRFGQYGSAEQLELLELTLRRLDAELDRLHEGLSARIRCRAVLGVCTGLSLFLLVI